MKKIIFTFLVFLIVFIIYYLNISEKIYYLSMGDHLSYGINNFNKIDNNYNDKIINYYATELSNYVNYSSLDDYRVMDLINDINYNKNIIYNDKEYKLQNLLIKSNLIILSIGMNDIVNKKNISYDYIDLLIEDINNLFILLRKYNKDKIYFLGFYDIINNKDLIEYANKEIERKCNKNKINYVDISNLSSYIIKDTYPTNNGYNYIMEQIKSLLKN